MDDELSQIGQQVAEISELDQLEQQVANFSETVEAIKRGEPAMFVDWVKVTAPAE